MIEFQHSLLLLTISIITTALAETASYFMIYSKEYYKTTTKEIKSLTKKIDLKKEDPTADTKTTKKKVSQMENKLKFLTSNMTFYKMKSTFVIGLFAIVTLSSLGNYFEGIPVARLPFTPIGLFTPMTHRGLGGEDFTECSYILIYMLSSFILRQNIQKIFGFEGAKTNTNLFMPPSMQL